MAAPRRFNIIGCGKATTSALMMRRQGGGICGEIDAGVLTASALTAFGLTSVLATLLITVAGLTSALPVTSGAISPAEVCAFARPVANTSKPREIKQNARVFLWPSMCSSLDLLISRVTLADQSYPWITKKNPMSAESSQWRKLKQ